MRPVDLARPHGLSTQAVRNYEDAGILPTADRTESGYRTYTPLHAQALRTFLALLPGHSHATATAIMVAVNTGRTADALTLIDRSHAGLLADRTTVDAVEHALAELTEPVESTSRPTSIGTLAHQLDLRPTTLRRWERAGLLRPNRDPHGYRTYTAEDIRDARIVGQLRRSGYLLDHIAPLLADLRTAGDPARVTAALTARRALLDTRARAMLAAAGELSTYLGLVAAQ